MKDKDLIPFSLVPMTKPSISECCPLTGWLPDTTDRYGYFCTLTYCGIRWAAVFAGYDLYQKAMEVEDLTEKPYLIYLKGCDDGHLGLRFKTEEEMNEWLSLLETVGDVFNHPDCLHYN